MQVYKFLQIGDFCKKILDIYSKMEYNIIKEREGKPKETHEDKRKAEEMKMKKQVMVRAWQIIKAAVAEFGGKCRDYSFSAALRYAWEEVRKEEHEEIIAKQHHEEEIKMGKDTYIAFGCLNCTRDKKKAQGYMTGDTYAHKDAIKKAGFRWNGEEWELWVDAEPTPSEMADKIKRIFNEIKALIPEATISRSWGGAIKELYDV